MNKRVLNISLFLLLASTGNVLAQQGIGTNTPHRSAALHVDSQNKGLLIPRMNLTHSQTNGITAPITNPAQGLLVYNNQSYPVNATGQDVLVPEGFYYFDGTNWNPISKSYLENSSYTTILGTGTSSDPYKINLVHASSTEYGVVKIGSGINVSDGVISVPAAPGETTTVITDALTGTNKHKIADYKNETTNPVVDIFETVTSLSQNIDGISYTDETGTKSAAAKIVSKNTDNIISVDADFGALLTKEDVQSNQVKYEVINGENTTAALDVTSTDDLKRYKVDVNKATASTLGVVMPGTNVTVDTDGKLNVALDGSETKLANGLITTVDGAGTTASPYTVDVNKATASTLGVVMPGTNVTVDTDGKLNVALDGSETKLADGLNTTVSGTGTETDQYKVNVATATTAAVGVVKPGTGLNVATDGTLNVTVVDTNTDVQQLSLASNTLTLERGGSVNLNLVSLAGEVTGPLNATVVADNVIDAANLKADAVTTVKILDKNVTPAKIEGGTEGQVLTTNTAGEATWVTPTDNNTITTVKADAAQSYVSVTSNPVTPGATGNREYTVGVNAATAQVGTTAGTLGVVKPSDQFEIAPDGHLKIKYATPEFFYMPALLIPLSGQTNAEGFLSLDLHGKYQERFNTPAVVSADSELANLSSLVVPINMLDIYITYFDEQVLEDVSIDTDGKMWYKVKANYNYTEASFMNVVFKVRNQPKP